MPEHGGPHPHEIIERTAAEHSARGHALDRRERVLELIAVVILAVATLATAWSGYQATRWSGVTAEA